MADKHQCSATASDHDSRWPRYYQCTRNATVEHDGKWYCGIHDPVRKAERDSRRYAETDARDSARIEKVIFSSIAVKACSRIPIEALEAGIIQDLLSIARMMVSLESEDGGRSYPSKDMIAAAHAAIAKATGETA